MQSRDMFLEDLAKSLDYWVREIVTVLVDPAADLTWTDDPASFRRLQEAVGQRGLTKEDVEPVVSESLRGFVVSVLTIIDGGTDLARRLRLALVDESGTSLGEALHDEFVSHLIKTGRMK